MVNTNNELTKVLILAVAAGFSVILSHVMINLAKEYGLID